MVELNEERIIELVSTGESEILEFKTSLRDPATLAKNLSAFANTAGGTLLIGIQEPDIVVGANEAQIKHLLERSKKLLSSPVDIEIQTISVEQKSVVVVTVKLSHEIVFCRGQALGRVGDMIRPLSSKQVSSKLGTKIARSDIDKIADSISKQTRTIEKLRDELREANSFKSKLKDYSIGGTIGAFIGFLLSLLLKIS